MTTNRTALVLGATGGIGGEVARLLVARGWEVRALHRDLGKLSASNQASDSPGFRVMPCPHPKLGRQRRESPSHAVNPPGYRNWGELVLPMLDNTTAAARSNGARIVLPGTIYNFGPDAFPNLHETSLLERPEALETFAVFHMDGHWDADGMQMINAIRRVVGNPKIRVAKTPWWLMRLLSPFVPLVRELTEMRYLWNTPIRMDNRHLKAVLGTEPHTPLDVAVRKTLIGLGCLPRDANAN